jgi:hypothetical protein
MTPEQLEESLRRVRAGRRDRGPQRSRHASTLSRLLRTLVEIAIDPELATPAEREAEIESVLRLEERRLNA